VETWFVKVKGHSWDEENESVDAIVEEGVRRLR